MLIQIENLTFGWQTEKKLLFENINFNLNQKEIVQLSGENGSGKTTLLKLISGMIPHFTRGEILKGEVFINGRSVLKQSPKVFFPIIAFIPSLNLDFFLLTDTLAQEILLTRSILKISEGLVKKRLDEFCNFFPGLTDLMNVPLKDREFWQKILSLTFIFYLQNARLYLFDEVLMAFSESLIQQWYSFFNWLSSTECAIIFVDHQYQNKTFSQWLLKDKKLDKL
jgi:ABC-type Mn2+/Zn2+ transport system ATPase subunit